jgi:hypothetical protein
VMAHDINKEAPIVANHSAAQYGLGWPTPIQPNDLTACATVGAVVALIQVRYS